MPEGSRVSKKMGKNDLEATDGWFHRWKKRENIFYGKAHGEQGDADVEGAKCWLEKEWISLIAEYSPCNVFNADETALYYRALPEHTYAIKNDKIKRTEISKERMTLLCCASMLGEKKKLLVIGKSKQPRCFKGVKKLPVDYVPNSSLWMTQKFFSDWLSKWNRELVNQKRKILLLVDNCRAHDVNLNLKNIKLVFLPANTTSLIQPCDQGIIRALKAYYRSMMLKKIISYLDEILEMDSNSTLKANDLAKKINMLEALHLINEAWNNVSAITIQNGFRHGGFVKNAGKRKRKRRALLRYRKALLTKLTRIGLMWTVAYKLQKNIQKINFVSPSCMKVPRKRKRMTSKRKLRM